MLTGTAVQAAISSLFSMFSLALLFFSYYHWPCAALPRRVPDARRHRRIRAPDDQRRRQAPRSERREPRPRALGERLLRAETSVSSGAALGRGAARGHGHVQPLALGAIYEVVYYGGPTGRVPAMGLAAFLSFNAAFGQLTAAVNSLTIALTTSFGTVPLPSEWPSRGRKIRG